MKQKLYFVVVLSTLIAVCLPLTAKAVDEPAPESAAEPAAKPAVEGAAVKPPEEQAAKPSEEQAKEPAVKPAHELEITRASICRQVVEREPVDAGTSFEPPVEKLSCFTHVTGAQDPTEIYHIWYFGDIERAVVTLKVNSGSWRTYSSKIIQPHEIGDWRVDVLGPEGDMLKSVHFKITP